jgi:hypothetical protein
MLPFFPAPSDDIVAIASTGNPVDIIRACKLYRASARATLWNGDVVRPTIKLAWHMMRAIGHGMPAVALAVEPGLYSVVKDTVNV